MALQHEMHNVLMVLQVGFSGAPEWQQGLWVASKGDLMSESQD